MSWMDEVSRKRYQYKCRIWNYILNKGFGVISLEGHLHCKQVVKNLCCSEILLVKQYLEKVDFSYGLSRMFLFGNIMLCYFIFLLLSQELLDFCNIGSLSLLWIRIKCDLIILMTIPVSSSGTAVSSQFLSAFSKDFPQIKCFWTK